MILSAHQPNFIPWRPYFEKIIDADLFVIIKQCQFEKNGFQNRFHLAHGEWYTLPVCHGLKPIIEKNYVNPINDWKILKSKLPKTYQPIASIFDKHISKNLFITNTNIIVDLCKILGIDIDKIVYDFPTDKSSSERLIELCQYYRCSTYLSGAGALAYLNLDLFKKCGIKVIFQDDTRLIKKPIFKYIVDENIQYWVFT